MNLHDAFLRSKSAGKQELRKFGLMFSGVLICVFYLFIPWLKGQPGPNSVLLLGLAVSCLALLYPLYLRWLYVSASLVGRALGAVNQRILLTVAFFLLLTPLAVLQRWISRKDPMGRRFDRKALSYKVNCRDRDMIKNKERAF